MKITLPLSLALALLAIALLLAPTNPPAPVFAADPTPTPTKPFPIRSSSSVTSTYYFPLVFKSPGIDPCSSIPGQSYGSVAAYSPHMNPPAAQNADVNLDLRGYTLVNEYKGLWDYGGSSDSGAPQLSYLFSPHRLPTFTNTYQVGKWNWSCNCWAGWDDAWPVELLGMGTSTGEIIYTPQSGYDIGLRPTGYAAMVLYATSSQITFTYQRYDSIVVSDPNSPDYGKGYSINIADICVEPSLLALYSTLNSQGRTYLPALNTFQPFGRARGIEIKVAIRDSGAFLDPRSRHDWWDGY